jgi:hypothetical protein
MVQSAVRISGKGSVMRLAAAQKSLSKAAVFGSKVTSKAFWSVSNAISEPDIRDIHRRAEGPEPGEYVCATNGTAFIEPQWGYVITDNARLVEASLYPNFEPHNPLWRIGGASPSDFFRNRNKGRHFKRVISLRHFWEWNYYHFYFDVLGKLNLLKDVGITDDVPLVLGPYVHEMGWTRQILAQGELAKRTWIIPETEFISADEVVFCRTQQDYRLKMNHVMDQMGVMPKADQRNERIFLDRADAKNRRILNFAEIKAIADELGFRYVDSLSGLSVPQQIDLFANTRQLVAIHGAGITNVLFRRDAAMNVLELHSARYISTDFKRMCREYHHGYDTLPGVPEPGHKMHASFTLSPTEFRAKLQAMLATEHAQ